MVYWLIFYYVLLCDGEGCVVICVSEVLIVLVSVGNDVGGVVCFVVSVIVWCVSSVYSVV